MSHGPFQVDYRLSAYWELYTNTIAGEVIQLEKLIGPGWETPADATVVAQTAWKSTGKPVGVTRDQTTGRYYVTRQRLSA